MKRALALTLLVLLTGLVVMGSAAQETPAPGCVNGLPPRLILNERGWVGGTGNWEAINLRREPTTSGERLAQVQPGTVFFVLSGPECSPNYTWFRVRVMVDAEALEGWIAEGDATSYYVERFPPGL